MENLQDVFLQYPVVQLHYIMAQNGRQKGRCLRPKLWRDVRPLEPRHTLMFYDPQTGNCLYIIDVSSQALQAFGEECLGLSYASDEREAA